MTQHDKTLDTQHQIQHLDMNRLPHLKDATPSPER